MASALDVAGAIVFTVACFLGAAGLIVTMVPRYRPARAADRIVPRHAVVVWCGEPLDHLWLPPATAFESITIYTKCGNPLPPLPGNVKTVQWTDNVGSCDHGFLRYIVDNYDDLPAVVEFKRAGTPLHANPPRPCRECDWRNRRGRYQQKDYKFSVNPVDKPHLQYVRSGYANMAAWAADQGEWASVLTRAIREDGCNQWQGGDFVATAERIRAHPRGLYQHLMGLQHHANAEVDHFIEHMWGALMCST